MGCWNQTCAITNLPIMDSDEVYVLVLQKGIEESPSLCYPTAYWTPGIFFFEGKYNDYGGAKDCHGPLMDYVVDGIRDILFEFEVGDNEYHDIAVKKEGFDVEMLFEANHEDRLYVNKCRILQFDQDRAKLRTVFVRKNVLDGLLTSYTKELYDGRTGDYITYGFNELHSEIRSIVIPRLDRVSDDPMTQIMWEVELREAIRRYTRETEGYGALFRACDAITSTNNAELIDHMLYQISVVVGLNTFMHDARKCWLPPTGAGSQESSVDALVILGDIIKKESALINNRWNEDYDEEEEE